MTKEADSDQILLTKEQAAKAVGVSPKTLDRASDLKRVRIGARVLFRPSTLHAWAAKHES